MLKQLVIGLIQINAKELITNLKIVFTQKLTLNCSVTWQTKNKGYNSIIILGNGSTINCNAGVTGKIRWLEMNDYSTSFIVNDLTIKNFNNAIKCHEGTCYLNNVQFDNNHNHFDFSFDACDGAAIYNAGGNVICNNCSFINNSARNGGAIYTTGFFGKKGIISLNNCTFEGNTADTLGNNTYLMMQKNTTTSLKW